VLEQQATGSWLQVKEPTPDMVKLTPKKLTPES